MVTGIIYWQVMDGKLDEAEQQIEFLTEIQSSIGKNTVSYSNILGLFEHFVCLVSLGVTVCECTASTKKK